MQKIFQKVLFSILFVGFLGFGPSAKAHSRHIVMLRSRPASLGPVSLSLASFQANHAYRLARFVSENPSVQLTHLDPLWVVQGFVADMDSQTLLVLQNHKDVLSVTPARRRVRPHLVESIVSSLAYNFEENLQSIKVDQAQKQFPSIDGRGVYVGVLDTGIVPQHPDLVGKIKIYKNFSPTDDGRIDDPKGHGTHVTGIIAGGNKSGRQIGVAPSAHIVFARIFDRSLDSSEELIIKGLQWMIDPKEDGSGEWRPRVINASWGSFESYNKRRPEEEPFCQAFKTLLAFEILPVVSAGNNGPREATINLPGSCPEAFTVGATDNWGRSPRFSSEGPALWKDLELPKPNVAAPGVDIKSSVGGFDDYEEMSGTSMSAPHVTGALALLFQKSPDLSVLDARRLVEATAEPLGEDPPNFSFGHGRIDVLKLLNYEPNRR